VRSIPIIVNNGSATLGGGVDGESDRILAGLRASQVPDVFLATNNLTYPGADKKQPVRPVPDSTAAKGRNGKVYP